MTRIEKIVEVALQLLLHPNYHDASTRGVVDVATTLVEECERRSGVMGPQAWDPPASLPDLRRRR